MSLWHGVQRLILNGAWFSGFCHQHHGFYLQPGFPLPEVLLWSASVLTKYGSPANFSGQLKTQKTKLRVSSHPLQGHRSEVRSQALCEVSMLKGCRLFYVWGLKQAFILQNVSEAQLDQHIWEQAWEDSDNIWISKTLHTKICLDTEEKYNTETQKPKIKNGKLKWQEVRAFPSFWLHIVCLFLKCSVPSAMENGSVLKTHKEDQHCAEEEARGQPGRCCTEGKEGCYKSQYSE